MEAGVPAEFGDGLMAAGGGGLDSVPIPPIVRSKSVVRSKSDAGSRSMLIPRGANTALTGAVAAIALPQPE
jgi:hypothetical protein